MYWSHRLLLKHKQRPERRLPSTGQHKQTMSPSQLLKQRQGALEETLAGKGSRAVLAS